MWAAVLLLLQQQPNVPLRGRQEVAAVPDNVEN